MEPYSLILVVFKPSPELIGHPRAGPVVEPTESRGPDVVTLLKRTRNKNESHCPAVHSDEGRINLRRARQNPNATGCEKLTPRHFS
jgi:hypothetical protein